MNHRIRPLAAVAALLVLLAPVLATPGSAQARPDSAAAPTTTGCTELRPKSDYYAAGRVATVLLTVPANKYCTTISVSQIVDAAVPSDRCQDFLVIFYPTDGGEPIATEPVTACSRHALAPPVVLVAGVPDGVQYRVLYEVDYLGQNVRFTVSH